MNNNSVSAHYLQMSWVVDDLQSAMDAWLHKAGVGPFFVMENLQPEPVFYRGQPAELAFNVAMAQAGPMQIELIQQLSEGPSAYRDSVDKGSSGFHHLAVIVDDYEREMALYRATGFVPATEAIFGDIRYAYVDTRSGPTACMVEVIQDNPGIRELFHTIASAAVGWDGKDPVRYLD